MFTLSSLKQLDPTKINLTCFDVRNLEMPKFEMPEIDLPKFEMPKFEMPSELPKVDLPLDRVAGLARDAAYVGVGAAVVITKVADDRRRAVTEQVTGQVRKLVDAVA